MRGAGQRVNRIVTKRTRNNINGIYFAFFIFGVGSEKNIRSRASQGAQCQQQDGIRKITTQNCD